MVAVRKCESHGLCCDALKDEMVNRKRYAQELVSQNCGLTKQQVKQLPTSILNGGTIEGWKHNLVKDSGILFDRIKLPKVYHDHYRAIMKEVSMLRDIELELPLGKRCLQYCIAEGKRRNNAVSGEDLKRKAMNRIYCTVGSEIIGELSAFLASLDIPELRIQYPVYDGVVLEHSSGTFCWSSHSADWDLWCKRVFGHTYPAHACSLTDRMPVWWCEMHGIVRDA